MNRLQIILLVPIVIGLGLLTTQKLWVPGLVEIILHWEGASDQIQMINDSSAVKEEVQIYTHSDFMWSVEDIQTNIPYDNRKSLMLAVRGIAYRVGTYAGCEISKDNFPVDYRSEVGISGITCYSGGVGARIDVFFENGEYVVKELDQSEVPFKASFGESYPVREYVPLFNLKQAGGKINVYPPPTRQASQLPVAYTSATLTVSAASGGYPVTVNFKGRIEVPEYQLGSAVMYFGDGVSDVMFRSGASVFNEEWVHTYSKPGEYDAILVLNSVLNIDSDIEIMKNPHYYKNVVVKEIHISVGTHAVAETKVYTGSFFSISYPANFIAKAEDAKGGGSSEDEASFTSPDGAVQFHVYSPQWGGKPAWYLEALPSETKVSEATSSNAVIKSGNVYEITLMNTATFAAKDGSYKRVFESRLVGLDTNPNAQDLPTAYSYKVFGIRYKDQATYDKHFADYLAFQESLAQYADH